MSKPFYTFANAIVASDAAPGGDGRWMMLLPAGKFSARDGRGPYVTGDAAAMGAIVAATRQRAGATELMVDYDHQSVFSSVPGVGGRAPAAGWVKDLEVRADGIWGRVQWTAAAAEAIKAGEYRYLSPYFSADQASGRVGVIASVGLTNVPAHDLGGAVAARAFGDTQPMDKIKAALGLPADADENAAVAAIDKLKDAGSQMAGIAMAAGLTAEADAAAITLAVQQARAVKPTAPSPSEFVPMAQFVAVRDQLAGLVASTTEAQAVAAVDAAMADGKIAPASRDWALNYARTDAKGFAAFTAVQPAIVVPPQPRPGVVPKTADLTESDFVAMRALGMTEADFNAAKLKEISA